MKKKFPFKPIPSPFGTGNDEQATTDAFVDYVGGRTRADQLFRIYQNSYPAPAFSLFEKGKTKAEVFRIKAVREGFTDEEVDALLALQ